MPRQQRNYTQEFRQEAVRLVETSGKPMTQIARDLGVSDSALSAWAKQAKALGSDAFPGSGHQTPLEEENRRLKRELAVAEQERDILKKHMACTQTREWMKMRRELSGRGRSVLVAVSPVKKLIQARPAGGDCRPSS